MRNAAVIRASKTTYFTGKGKAGGPRVADISRSASHLAAERAAVSAASDTDLHNGKIVFYAVA